jgi:predicted component of type VI protein secretion system
VIFKLRNVKTHQASAIPPGVMTVGRDEACDLPLPDDLSVSRSHARIINEDDALWVEDAGSSNGTAVRGEYVQARTKAEIGDTIHFGTVLFRVESEIPGASIAPPEPKPVNRPSLTRATEKMPPKATLAPMSAEPIRAPISKISFETPISSPIPVAQTISKKTGPIPVNGLPPGVSPVPAAVPASAGSPTIFFVFGSGIAVGIVIGVILYKFVILT